MVNFTATLNDQDRNNPRAIRRISVDGLFGQFSYELPPKESEADLSQLFSLYGDNGSGKTTLLRLLYHLLSSEANRGHKHVIAKVQFRRFAVEFGDGTVVEARRMGNADKGSYRATILKGSKIAVTVDVPSSGTEEEVLLGQLKDLGVFLRFLSDDRRIFAPDAVPSTDLENGFDEAHSRQSSPVARAIHHASAWINQEIQKSSSLGEGNIHSFYTEFTKHLATPTPQDARQNVVALIDLLEALSARSLDYSGYGLTTAMPVDDMVRSLRAATSETASNLYQVISPYAQSVETRLKALEGVHNLITTFVGHVNEFFAGRKRLNYELRRGFAITSRNGEPVDLGEMSSGEKQLLLILCNALVARDRGSILIIDEPESSFNVKWQRGLIPALLDCTHNSHVQLVIATHSIELLAQYDDQVAQLIDVSNGEKTTRTSDEVSASRSEADNQRVESPI